MPANVQQPANHHPANMILFMLRSCPTSLPFWVPKSGYPSQLSWHICEGGGAHEKVSRIMEQAVQNTSNEDEPRALIGLVIVQVFNIGKCKNGNCWLEGRHYTYPRHESSYGMSKTNYCMYLPKPNSLCRAMERSNR